MPAAHFCISLHTLPPPAETVSIVENLMLAWPRSAHTVVSFMVVNGLQLEAVRPECVFDQSASATELPWFFIFAIAKVTIPLLLLVSLALVRWSLQLAFSCRNGRDSSAAAAGEVGRRGSRGGGSRSGGGSGSQSGSGGGSGGGSERDQAFEARLDKLELLETIVFGLVLVTSWRSIWDLYDARNTGADPLSQTLAQTGAALAAALLAIQVLFVTRYFINYRTMVAKEREGEGGGEGGSGSGGRRGGGGGGGSDDGAPPAAPPHAHQKHHPSHKRSLRLSAVDLSLTRLQYRLSYQTKRFAHHACHWQFVIWLRQLLLTLIVLLPRFLERTDLKPSEPLTGSAALNEPLVWLQAGLALFILCIFWLWHAVVKPFSFTFQNNLEHFLFFCSFAILLLSMAYTFPNERSLVVEILLTGLLLVSIASAGLVGCAQYRRHLRKKSRRRGSRRRRSLASRIRASCAALSIAGDADTTPTAHDPPDAYMVMASPQAPSTSSKDWKRLFIPWADPDPDDGCNGGGCVSRRDISVCVRTNERGESSASASRASTDSRSRLSTALAGRFGSLSSSCAAVSSSACAAVDVSLPSRRRHRNAIDLPHLSIDCVTRDLLRLDADGLAAQANNIDEADLGIDEKELLDHRPPQPPLSLATAAAEEKGRQIAATAEDKSHGEGYQRTDLRSSALPVVVQHRILERYTSERASSERASSLSGSSLSCFSDWEGSSEGARRPSAGDRAPSALPEIVLDEISRDEISLDLAGEEEEYIHPHEGDGDGKERSPPAAESSSAAASPQRTLVAEDSHTPFPLRRKSSRVSSLRSSKADLQAAAFMAMVEMGGEDEDEEYNEEEEDDDGETLAIDTARQHGCGRGKGAGSHASGHGSVAAAIALFSPDQSISSTIRSSHNTMQPSASVPTPSMPGSESFGWAFRPTLQSWRNFEAHAPKSSNSVAPCAAIGRHGDELPQTPSSARAQEGSRPAEQLPRLERSFSSATMRRLAWAVKRPSSYTIQRGAHDEDSSEDEIEMS